MNPPQLTTKTTKTKNKLQNSSIAYWLLTVATMHFRQILSSLREILSLRYHSRHTLVKKNQSQKKFASTNCQKTQIIEICATRFFPFRHARTTAITGRGILQLIGLQQKITARQCSEPYLKQCHVQLYRTTLCMWCVFLFSACCNFATRKLQL